MVLENKTGANRCSPCYGGKGGFASWPFWQASLGNIYMYVNINIYSHMLLLLSHFSRVWLLCNPIDSSPPGSPVPGILQARTLEWVAISFSNAGKWKVKVESLSCVWFLATPWTAAYQAPPPMGFSRKEYWSGVIFIHMCTQNVYPHTYTCFRNHESTLTPPFPSSWNNFLPSPNPYIFLSFLLRYNWQIKL